VGCLQSNVTSPAWKNKPTFFVVATNDRAIPPELEKAEAARVKATTITLTASHLAVLAKPREVAAL
jgi:hypothetical protein